MTPLQRKQARARAEMQDKIKKDLRNGIVTKAKAKQRAKAR